MVKLRRRYVIFNKLESSFVALLPLAGVYYKQLQTALFVVQLSAPKISCAKVHPGVRGTGRSLPNYVEGAAEGATRLLPRATIAFLTRP